MTAENIQGSSIALIDESGTIWSEGFGFSDSTKKNKVTQATLFAVGSVSKVFTCTGFLHLSEQGKIKLDDKLTRVYKDFQINDRYTQQEAGRITFRHLLSHWAGLLHETPVGGNYDVVVCTFEDHIKSISGGWLKSPVGSKYSYSNLGVDLAGYCIQQVSGQSFDTYIKNNVFIPLGMTRSTFNLGEAAATPDIAKGYYYGTEVVPRNLQVSPSSSMYSSSTDLARFILMRLQDGRSGKTQIISRKNMLEMARIQFTNSDTGYGLCLVRAPFFNADTLLSHNGSGRGFCSKIGWLPGHKIGVVVLCNADEVSFCENVLQEALKLMLEEKNVTAIANQPANENAPAMDSIKLKKYTGRFKSYYTIENLQQKGDTLWWVRNAHYKIQLKPANDSTFYAGADKLIFHFEGPGETTVKYRNDRGDDTWFLNDRPDDPPGPDRQNWKSYLGKYKFSIYGQFPFASTVFVKNGYLYCSRYGGLKLREYKDNIFFTPDGEAVVFENDKMVLGGRPAIRLTDK